jgi:hypothetical protein
MVAPSSQQPVLSVVMPNYNHGAVLPKAVEAFLNQDVPVEILIVDDASTDNSVDIVRSLCAGHPQVKLIEREQNEGPNVAVNHGLTLARGEFVTFAAADDVVSRSFAAQSIALLKENPESALCFADHSLVFDRETGRHESVSLALAPRPTCFAPKEIENMLRSVHFSIPSNSVVYRREAVQAAGGFRSDLLWHSDWLAIRVLCFRHGACYIPEAIAHFFVDDAGYGNRGVRSGDAQRAVLLHCLGVLERDYGDVQPAFRRAAILPEMRVRTLLWLLSDERGRRFLTVRLALRLIVLGSWNALRPIVPYSARRWMRRQVARLSLQDRARVS